MKVDALMDVDTNPHLVKPEDRDHMPVEVAIERLTNAKGRYTRRDRKVAKEAREKVYPSIAPIRREDDHFVYVPVKKDPDKTLAAKMREKSAIQLLKLSHRSLARRRIVQRQYLKLGEKPFPKNISQKTEQFLKERRNQALALLEMTATQLESQHDAACDELIRRRALIPKQLLN
jgi:hypothetical protein